MSICVLVKVSEGLVLATDSASSVFGAPVLPGGQPGPSSVIKIFFTGRKLFQLGQLPIGIMTWGAGSFKERTIASLVEEFENKDFCRMLKPESLELKNVADELWIFLKTSSDNIFQGIPPEGRPPTGVIIGGYSANKFFPEEYGMLVPTTTPYRARPDQDGNPNFGANWYGLTDAIVRFHYGRDDRIVAIMQQVGVPEETVQSIMARVNQEIQYSVLFNAMPLQDAIGYARFLVELTIRRFRYVAGAELCGGPITIATITRKEGYTLIREA
jgi:hypothetical protein